MRILFVGIPDSIHTARWISQIADLGWDLHLFPCDDVQIHPELINVSVHDGIFRDPNSSKNIHQPGAFPLFLGGLTDQINLRMKRLRSSKHFSQIFVSRSERLARLIHRLKPDIIHSLEFQHSGYLVLDAKKASTRKFPAWMATNWGSDIYLFGRLEEHAKKIKEVLQNCDYYSCECQRDVELGRAFGFKGDIMPVIPNTGGINLELIRVLRQPGPVSQRKWILLKGYQSWAGRALVGLRALELCSDILQGFKIGIYLANDDVILKARLFSNDTGIPIEIIPNCSHQEMLRWHGRARVSIGLSISDAISTSFLEALMMGSFPIQSCTGCANEWIINGDSGLLVPPEDPIDVASAIREALTNDGLVDRADRLNADISKARLDRQLIRPAVIKMYEQIKSKNK